MQALPQRGIILTMYKVSGTTRRTTREKCDSNIRAIQIAKSHAAARSGSETLNESSNHPPDLSPEDQDTLASYCGWGDSDVRALAFNWHGEPLPPLDGLLTRDEIEGARKSTLNAHYTDPTVARAMWTVANRLLRQSGILTERQNVSRIPSILEPSCGNGLFWGTCPEDLQQSVKVGVEMDPLTAEIASALYPDVKVICAPFERAKLPPSYFDLVIGNVPFADVHVVDDDLPKYLRQTLHDYFICKSLTLVRPGGIIALITSKGTLDKKAPHVRRWLSERADLIGAMRLPSNAFVECAGTQVTTDILFLQRLPEGITRAAYPNQIDWINVDDHTADVPAAWGNVESMTSPMNRYFIGNPTKMLGTLCRDKLIGGRDARFGLLAHPDASPLAEQIIDAAKSFDAPIYIDAPAIRGVTFNGDPPKVAGTPHGHAGIAGSTDIDPAVSSAIAIHKIVKSLLSAEASGESDIETQRLRRRLNTAYDLHHKQWGRFDTVERRDDHPLADFQKDPRWPLLLSLETLRGKAPIFHRRTLRSFALPSGPLPPQDALYHCLDTMGSVDLDRVAALAQITPDEARDALRGQIFGVGQGWQTADRYLSGNVVSKLTDVRAAASIDPAYTENVKALEAVRPEPLDHTQIKATLGAPWIPADTVAAFALSLFPGHTWGVHVKHIEPTATWTVEVTNAAIERSEENRSVIGAPRMYGLEILEHALNLKTPVIYDEYERDDGSTYRVRNEQETAAAQGKLVELRDKWGAWVWADAERAATLCDIYNARFNNTRPRQFDGSHLTFPGLASEIDGKPFALRKHQVDGAARILSDGDEDRGTLLTWSVGLGKTWGAICGVVKRVQLGLSRRAMFVVPKHTLPQWRTAFLNAYPGLADEVMAATDDAFGPLNRKRFLAGIASGDCCYAILTYEQFKTIPLDRETFQRHLDSELSDLRAHLDAAIEGSDEQKSLKRAFKQREKTLLRFAARYEENWNRATKGGDAPIMWEELGVDLLVWDEAHMLKNDMITTHMTNIAGLPRSESHRAFDARVKAHTMLSRGGRLVGLTGTPITNTLAEAWIMMRLFQPRMLRRLGLQHFDSWAATFAEPYLSVEMDSVGKFRTQTRLKFQNVPELITILGEAWDRASDE